MDRRAAPGYLCDAPADVPSGAPRRSYAIPQPIRITVNGQERELPRGSDLAALLRLLDVPPRHIAIELNGALHEGGLDTALEHDDRVEIVRFVGGG